MPKQSALLNQLLNQTLEMDPAAAQKCAELEGKSFAVQFSDLHLTLCFEVKHQRLNVMMGQPEKVDAVVTGATLGLMKLAFSKNSQLTFFENHLEIRGNLAVAESFQALIKEMDIDWEEALSSKIGDTAAFYVGQSLCKAARWLGRLARQTRRDAKDYLTEEADYLPIQSEVEQFYREIYELNEAVERLSARIHYLSKSSRLS